MKKIEFIPDSLLIMLFAVIFMAGGVLVMISNHWTSIVDIVIFAVISVLISTLVEFARIYILRYINSPKKRKARK